MQSPTCFSISFTASNAPGTDSMNDRLGFFTLPSILAAFGYFSKRASLSSILPPASCNTVFSYRSGAQFSGCTSVAARVQTCI